MIADIQLSLCPVIRLLSCKYGGHSCRPCETFSPVPFEGYRGQHWQRDSPCMAFKDDLKDLEERLTMLNYLLSRAESKFRSGSPEFENPMLRKWVKKVADVAYRAEDVVDEYAYDVLKRKLALRDMGSMQPLLRFKTRVRLFCFCRSSNLVLLCFRMAHKAKSLKESIAEVYADAKDLGIRPVEVVAASSNSTDHPTKTEMELQLQREQVDNYEVLVGRDDIKAQIIQQLNQASNSPKRLTVVGVHGMSVASRGALSCVHRRRRQRKLLSFFHRCRRAPFVDFVPPAPARSADPSVSN